MDDFKKAQNNHIGIGGMKCRCCNRSARHRNRNHYRVDKRLNRMARAKLKETARKEIVIAEAECKHDQAYWFHENADAYCPECKKFI